MKSSVQSLAILFLLLLISVHLSGCSGIKEKVDKIKSDIKNINEIRTLVPNSSLPSRSSQLSQSSQTESPVISNSTISSDSASETLVKTELLTNSTAIVSPEFCKDEVRWRYIVENAIFCAINQNELLSLSNLALKLKGNNIRDSVWNVLEWENSSIEYDWKKASLPPPELVYWSDGRVEVVKGKENIIQTPTETIQRGRGICSDYAVLTIALLLEMGYQPVYLLDIKFENSPVGHTTAAVKISGQYFAVDQHPPVLDLGSYYKKWKANRGRFGSRIISTITVYAVEVENNSIKIVNLGNLTADEIKNLDYSIGEKDLKAIDSTIMGLLEGKFNLKRDRNLNDLDRMKYMPPGYEKGGTWKIRLSYFAEYYNPVFHKQFSEYIFKQMLRPEIVIDLGKSNRFWVKVEREGEDLVVKLYFARKA